MRKTLWVALLVVLGVVAVPADASPGHYLTLRGSRSASAVLTFGARFRPELGMSAAPDMTVTTKGAFAGAWFENLSRPVLSAGAIVVPAMEGAGGPMPVGWGGSDRDDSSLPAGRYRVHLLTDGVAQVRVRVTGLARDLTLTPTTLTKTASRLVKSAVPGGSAGRAEIPFNVRPTTTTVLLASTDADWGLGAASSICVDGTAAAPCEVSGSGVKGGGGGIGSRMSTIVGIYFYPEDLANGEHSASYASTTSGVPRGMWAFALSLQ